MQVAGGLVETMSGGVSTAPAAPNASRAKAPADQDPSATPAFAAMLTGAMTPPPQPEPAARPHPTAETKGELAEGTAQETGEEGTSTTGASAKVAAPQLVAGQHPADALRFGLRADAAAPNAAAPNAVAPNAVAHAATADAAESADVGATKGARRRTRGEDAEEQDGKDATVASASADATQLARAMEPVDPALRARLEHVVERMRAEGGHESDTDAGASASTRQDGRTVQVRGRTHDGAAVTSPIQAPDVAVDGGLDDKAAFEQFQRVAGQDALPDASHHELPQNARVEQLTVQGAAQSAPPAAQAAALAALAALATAQGRATAEVTSDAKTDAKTEATVDAVEAPADGARARTAFLQATHAALAAQRGDASRSSDGGDRRGSQRTPQRAVSGAGARSASASSTGAATAGAPAASTLGTPAFSAPADVAAPAPLTGALSAERVAHLLETRDSAPAQPMSSLTLSIDNLAGGVDRIRIGLRGLEVGTSIDLADKSVAERVQAGIGELRSALGRHGLTTDTVQISSAGRAAEAVDSGRLVAAAAGASGADRSGTSTSSGSSQQQSSQQQARDPRDAARDAARENNPDQRRNRRDTQSSEDGEPNTGRRSRRDRR
jgi:hypothetical protein